MTNTPKVYFIFLCSIIFAICSCFLRKKIELTNDKQKVRNIGNEKQKNERKITETMNYGRKSKNENHEPKKKEYE